MNRWIGSAPVRLDLAGGTLDIWPLHLVVPPPAITVNVALDLPMSAVLEPASPGDDAIVLRSEDRGREERHADLAALARAVAEGRSRLALHARAVLEAQPRGGFTLTTRARIPVGSGLGGSSSLLAVVMSTLFRWVGRNDDAEQIRRIAQDVEAALLGGPTGYQDYYPPLHGGCLALEGRPGRIAVERLPVDLDALAGRIRLVYTGAPHDSGLTNWGVLRAYFDRDPATVAAIHEIAGHSRTVAERLRAHDLDGALAEVVAEGRVRRRMAPGVATAEIDALDEAVRSAGAVGTKILGAGGGGCVLVVLPDAGAPAVDTLLARGPAQVLPLALTPTGLTHEVRSRT